MGSPGGKGLSLIKFPQGTQVGAFCSCFNFTSHRMFIEIGWNLRFLLATLAGRKHVKRIGQFVEEVATDDSYFLD